jgi:uncharacterized ferritin-like protein (DUF455 family)
LLLHGVILTLTNGGDPYNAAALKIIMTDEVGHMAVGKRCFDYVSGLNRLNPVKSCHRLVTQYLNGDLNQPSNHATRRAVKLSSTFHGSPTERYD